MEFLPAKDIQSRVRDTVLSLKLDYINPERVKCFRSFGAKTRARARIWSFPKIWQLALKIPPHYIIEVISEKFDKLPTPEQEKTLIHELLHIPKNFSGALLPHRSRGRSINNKIVEKLFERL